VEHPEREFLWFSSNSNEFGPKFVYFKYLFLLIGREEDTPADGWNFPLNTVI
jgi:hypothetical protein